MKNNERKNERTTKKELDCKGNELSIYCLRWVISP